MEAFFISTALVTIAEIGDKTQLLSFVLAAKLKKKWPIVLGILVATLANHYFAGWVGAWVAQLIPPQTMRWVIAISFLGFGLWALVPDKLDENKTLPSANVFITTVVAFFIVEMGDKTQLATVALAAKYQSLVAVVTGTTLGMMVANVPAVLVGEALSHKMNMKYMRWIAAGLFMLLGVITFLASDASFATTPR